MRLFVFCILQVLVITGFSQNLPKNSWRIVSIDSEERNEPIAGSGRASCIIDNNYNTFWNTAYKTQNIPFPHSIVIDLGGFADLSGFTFYPRLNAAGGKIAHYKLFVSKNLEHWKLIKDGVFNWKQPYDNDPQHLTLKYKINSRYVKLVVVKSVEWQNTTPNAHLAELDMQGTYTTPFILPRISIKNKLVIKNEFGEFVDSSLVQGTEISSWEWHFPGGIPTVSRERNQKVQYSHYGKYSASLTITSKEGKKKSVTLRDIITYLPAPEIERTNWKLTVSDQELSNGDSESNMLDNDPKTHWHTSWFEGIKLPHVIQIDLGKKMVIHGIGYLPRQTGALNGIFSSYRIFVSNDSLNFPKEVIHISESKPYRALRYIEFPASKGRYVKIVIDKTFPFGKNFASASEIYVYGETENSWSLWLLIGSLLLGLLLFMYHSLRRKQTAINPIELPAAIPTDLVPDKNVKIFLFGAFRIVNEDKNVEGLYNKIKQIFVLIAYHTIENSGITTKDISRILWSDLPSENVTSARSSSIKKLRLAIEALPDIQIVIENKTWKLQTTEQVYVDFKVYRQLYLLLSDAIKTNQYKENEINSFLSIIERGCFMNDFEADWADDIKNKISEEILELLREINSHFMNQLPRKLKSRVCDCLFLQDELNTDALRIKLKLYIEDSNLGIANTFYETFSRKYKLIYKESFPISFAEIIGNE